MEECWRMLIRAHPEVRMKKKRKKESFVCKTTNNNNNTPLLLFSKFTREVPEHRGKKAANSFTAGRACLSLAKKRQPGGFAGPMWM